MEDTMNAAARRMMMVMVNKRGTVLCQWVAEACVQPICVGATAISRNDAGEQGIRRMAAAPTLCSAVE